ncbi:MAG: nucleotidyl transferase AbiEii/AbiGii toxin family protein [Gammaproteobacteria bacterium]
MQYHEQYLSQVKLLLTVIPLLNQVPEFALKGGTAINLYLKNMPRLSVDIDLTYLSLLSRQESIEGINNGLKKLKKEINRIYPSLSAQLISQDNQYSANKIIVTDRSANIKIEPNFTLRGSVFPPTHDIILCDYASDLFQMSHAITTLSPADIYAGKFCAALSRQHPRDLFDVIDIISQKTLPTDWLDAFVVYLASANKPFDEILAPKLKSEAEQKIVFEKQLLGMLKEPIQFDTIKALPKQLANLLIANINENQKQFLLSFAAGEPEWHHLPFSHLSSLPALQWKVLNIRKMTSEKRKLAWKKLEQII